LPEASLLVIGLPPAPSCGRQSFRAPLNVFEAPLNAGPLGSTVVVETGRLVGEAYLGAIEIGPSNCCESKAA
jgi:hypothetical protein